MLYFLQMRNPNRIKRILAYIKELTIIFPDKTMAEIIYYHVYKNSFVDNANLVVIEDDLVEEELINLMKWLNEKKLESDLLNTRQTENYKLKLRILKKIELYWLKWTDLRFGQMMGAHLLDIYNNYLLSISDEKFEQLIDERLEEFNY